MAFVRAILRTDLTDLTVVTYGGPDVGLLCAAGKVQARLLRLRVARLDRRSRPTGSPRPARAAPSKPEIDEGMLRCGLQAAAQRVPFLPMRAGLGSSVLDVGRPSCGR